ncbi:MAG: fibrillarin-like rRNA/tRNA 2'-O-methyltransferase [Candidatus Hadarchaeales archaeon]
MPRVIPHEKIENVFWIEFEDKTKKLATKSLVPGCKAYADEKTFSDESGEYRIWDPYRSKLAAAILKGLEEVPIKSGVTVLYLGAASGTTASFVSDLAGSLGKIFCVEISSRPLHDLMLLCSKRKNMCPILADARDPSSYSPLVNEVDVIYQDVAQPNQVEILLENVKMFLKDGGHTILALKARAIDVTKEPREIFRDEMEKLGKEMEIIDTKILDPYEKDHAMMVLQK